MKKIFNLRLFFILFLSLLAGIFAIVEYRLKNIIPLIVLGVVAFLVFTYILLCLFLNKPKFLFSKAKLAFIIVLIIGFCFGAVLGNISYNNHIYKDYNQEVVVQGTVTSIGTTKNSHTSLLLTDVDINNVNIDANIMACVIADTILDDQTFNIGDVLVFKCELETSKIDKNGEVNTYIIKYNIGYFAFVNGFDVQTVGNNITLAQKFKQNVKETLNANLDKDIASLSYAVLFGDKSQLDLDIKNAFSLSGVAHLLAVSGLHIGVLIGAIYFVLKKTKLKNYINLIIVLAFVIIFNILCEFTPSVVRASIMSIAIMLADVFSKRSDVLSNLSIAGIILLIVNPLNLYDLGFCLSFLSVFGIISLTNPISNVLSKIKCPKWLNKYVSATLGASIATLPLVANTFGFISNALIVSNIILIPIFSIYYVVLSICTILSLIKPLGFILAIPNLIAKIIIQFVSLFSLLGTTNTFVYNTISVLLVFLAIFFAGRYAMLKKCVKPLIVCSLIMVLIFNLIISNQPTIYKQYSFYTSSQNTNITVATTLNGDNYVLNIGSGDDADIMCLTEIIDELNMQKIKGVIVSNYSASMQNNLVNVCKNYLVEEVYIHNSILEYNKQALINKLPQKTNLNVLDFTQKNYIENNFYFYGIYASSGTNKFLVYNINNTIAVQNTSTLGDSQYIGLQEQLKESSINILLVPKLYSQYLNTVWITANYIFCNSSQINQGQKVLNYNSSYVKISLQGEIRYEIY